MASHGMARRAAKNINLGDYIAFHEDPYYAAERVGRIGHDRASGLTIFYGDGPDPSTLQKSPREFVWMAVTDEAIQTAKDWVAERARPTPVEKKGAAPQLAPKVSAEDHIKRLQDALLATGATLTAIHQELSAAKAARKDEFRDSLSLQDGSVLYFQKAFTPGGTVYSYAAILPKANIGKWYLTGPTQERYLSWKDLVAFIGEDWLHTVEELR